MRKENSNKMRGKKLEDGKLKRRYIGGRPRKTIRRRDRGTPKHFLMDFRQVLALCHKARYLLR